MTSKNYDLFDVLYQSTLQSETTMPYPLINSALSLPSITLLLQALVNQYLSDSYCLTFVLEQDIDFSINLSFTRITPNETVDELTKQLLEVSENACSDYIVYMRDPTVFMAAVDQTSKIGSIRRSNRKIIILPFSVDAWTEKALELFSMIESTFVANILMILPKVESNLTCDVYDLVTHDFLSLEKDEALYLDQWNSCSKKFTKNINLFPHDLQDLRGRKVRVACFHYTPYSLLNIDASIEPLQRDGIEVRIVDEFCRWVNCTIEIVDEEKAQWGDVFENGTGVGVLGSVAMDRADMGISALYSWHSLYVYMDFSAAGIRSGITCVAPSPKRIASWVMPFIPFSLSMWGAIAITYFSAVFGLMIAKKSFDSVFFTVFGMMVLQPQHDGESSWHIRRISVWMFGASLILVSAYGAGLASTFTVPKYEPSIDTMQDLVDRRMEWGATHDAWIFSLVLSTEPLILKLLSQFKIYSADELERRSFTGDMAFSIEKLPAGHFAIGKYVTKDALRDLQMMLEDFYYEQCVIMMRKSSVYSEKMTTLIGRLHQSGLLLTWETQVALKYLNYEVQQEVKLSRMKSDTTFSALNTHHVIGVYFIFIFGVILSFIIFLGEIIVERKSIKTTE